VSNARLPARPSPDHATTFQCTQDSVSLKTQTGPQGDPACAAAARSSPLPQPMRRTCGMPPLLDRWPSSPFLYQGGPERRESTSGQTNPTGAGFMKQVMVLTF
jgi:hypothetical protein